MADSLRAIDPVKVKTTDGKEYQFLLTRGSMRRLRERLGVSTLEEILAKVSRDDAGAISAFFYECLVDRNGISLEQFEDVMPVQLEKDFQTIFQILGVSMPAKSDRPTIEPAAPQIQ